MSNPKHNPYSWGTGYKPYYPTHNGVVGNRVPEREIDLKKIAGLPLGATEFLMELGDEGIQYSALGSIVAGTLTKEEEVTNLKFDMKGNHITHDFRYGRQGKDIEICRLVRKDKDGNHKEAQKGLLKLLISDKLIKLREEDYDLAEEMEIVEDNI